MSEQEASCSSWDRDFEVVPVKEIIEVMKYCKNCKASCTGVGGEGYAPNCTCYTEEKKKMTNADKVRSMTDEALAMIIMCPYEIEPDLCNGMKTCFECSLEWLQSEVKPE